MGVCLSGDGWLRGRWFLEHDLQRQRQSLQIKDMFRNGIANGAQGIKRFKIMYSMVCIILDWNATTSQCGRQELKLQTPDQKLDRKSKSLHTEDMVDRPHMAIMGDPTRVGHVVGCGPGHVAGNSSPCSNAQSLFEWNSQTAAQAGNCTRRKVFKPIRLWQQAMGR